jgi:hypothetical protein
LKPTERLQARLELLVEFVNGQLGKRAGCWRFSAIEADDTAL